MAQEIVEQQVIVQPLRAAPVDIIVTAQQVRAKPPTASEK